MLATTFAFTTVLNRNERKNRNMADPHWCAGIFYDIPLFGLQIQKANEHVLLK